MLRADPDQPRHREQALRAEPHLGASSRTGSPRAPNRSTRSAPRRTSSSRKVGRELYEKFFRGYTRKQWGLDPSRARQVGDGARADPHQPRRPLLHRRVPVHAEARLHADVRAHARPPEHQHHAADRLRRREGRGPASAGDLSPGRSTSIFGFRFGKLPYRSLRFEHVTLDQEWHQPVAVVNYPQTHDYTRVTEYKHLTGQAAPEDGAHLRVSRRPTAIPTTRSRSRRTRSCSRSTSAWRSRPRTCGSSGGSRPTATTTWIRSSARRSPPSAASTRRCRRTRTPRQPA